VNRSIESLPNLINGLGIPDESRRELNTRVRAAGASRQDYLRRWVAAERGALGAMLDMLNFIEPRLGRIRAQGNMLVFTQESDAKNFDRIKGRISSYVDTLRDLRAEAFRGEVRRSRER